MSATLETFLIIFIVVTIVVFILIAVYLVKLLMETTKLVNNINEISDIVKKDMGSVMSEIKVSLNGINSFVGATNKKVTALKAVALRLLGAGSVAMIGAKNFTGSFWKGLSTGLNIFRKKQ